jgi:hypothetical protein
VKFDVDIRPLFREEDRDAMLFAFDLWSGDDVAKFSGEILAQVESGAMPCDSAWDAARIATLRAWVAEGCRRGNQKPRP